MTPDEVKEAAKENSVVPQSDYAKQGYKLELAGTAKVGNEDAYKVKVTSPSGKISHEYYNVKSGYLVKEESSMEVQGQQIEQTVEFSNYVKVGNIFTPAKIVQVMGGQEMPMELTNIKFNEGVTDADFK